MKAAIVCLCLMAAVASTAVAVSDQALELRNLGVAQLENEQPGPAEVTFRRLIEVEEDAPLGYANLAIAQLRQQKMTEALASIDTALEKAPGRGDLLAIKGEILIWSGQGEEALTVLQEAAEAEPEHPEILYAVYRQATAMRGAEAEEAARQALGTLARLRPENLVVMLQLGQRAIAAGDRATASQAFLRIRELLWQAPPVATSSLENVVEGLEEADLEAARVPALRLENVMKITPMFKGSLAELYTAIQGMPLEHFADEPEAEAFGDPLEVRFVAAAIDASPTRERSLVAGDFDGDQRPDLARVRSGPSPGLEIRRAASSWEVDALLPAPPTEELIAIDLNNDGHLDLVGSGAESGVIVWQGLGDGRFEEATARFGLVEVPATTATAFDFDTEGDLDLVLGGPGEAGLDLFRNSLEGPLESVGGHALPPLRRREVTQLLASDPDRDGDLDLLVAHTGGVTWLDNLRQGQFKNRTAVGGLREAPATEALVSSDLDSDGWPELVLAGEGLAIYENLGGALRPRSRAGALPTSGSFSSLVAFDADNDGRLDLAASGSSGLFVLGQQPSGEFARLPIDDEPQNIAALTPRDLDGDGDVDLVAAGPSGLYRLDNVGGNRNRWLTVRLRGLNKGNDKNNVFGIGATLEVRAGRAFQFREMTEDVAHFGLGGQRKADLLRVTWNNGVPQNRIDPTINQLVVEEQILKGSCPFLYTWTGEGIAFVTDLLWGAPLGMPLAPGVWSSTDAEELVLVVGAQPREGAYDLRITEELWEAALFDYVRLWVVDHPSDMEVASSLRIVPGEAVPERVLATGALREVARAWDGRGREVTQRVRRRDETYADGYPIGPYQGVTEEPWGFTFDLGEAPASAIRLLLDGWIFPADASLNLAVAQRTDLNPILTRLEVETASGWQVLLSPMGFPAGKTKTMVIDTPPLPPGAHRLRIVSSRWLSWDRIVWSTEPADDRPVVRARLVPDTADLHFRGFSAMLRNAPNAPHVFEYARLQTSSPWLPFPGSYTRYGDVRELLEDPDDRMVILAPGDELLLRFDASHLPALRPGWTRVVFLESHGWDKDADRNTYAAQHLEPLPFRGMSGYPFGPSESYPDTPLHREYRRTWLTRVVLPQPLPPEPRTE